MDAVHDPAYDEPWRDAREPWRASLEPWRASLERSRARRGKPMPSAAQMDAWTTEWERPRYPAPGESRGDRNSLPRPGSPGGRRARPLALGRRPLALLASSAAVLVFIVVAVLPSASDGLGLRALVMSAHHFPAAASTHRRAAGPPVAPRTQAVASTRTSCELRSGAGYVNPLANATVTPKRIDQGVDYTAGSGTLNAIGPGIVTVVATTDTGWPGAFIEYRLTTGPAAGCFVFYAEGISPLAGLEVGDALRSGQPVASIIPGYASGIEIGWGAGNGTETYAAKMGEWSSTADADNIPTAAGESFSLLVASLGGPPGRLENTRR